MERLRVTVSFKHTEKDIELFGWVDKFDDKSHDIKAILRDYYEREKHKKQAQK